MSQKDDSKINKEVGPDNSRYRVIGLDSSCSSSCNLSEESSSACSSCSSGPTPHERGGQATKDLGTTQESSPEEIDDSLS